MTINEAFWLGFACGFGAAACVAGITFLAMAARALRRMGNGDCERARKALEGRPT